MDFKDEKKGLFKGYFVVLITMTMDNHDGNLFINELCEQTNERR